MSGSQLSFARRNILRASALKAARWRPRDWSGRVMAGEAGEADSQSSIGRTKWALKLLSHAVGRPRARAQRPFAPDQRGFSKLLVRGTSYRSDASSIRLQGPGLLGTPGLAVLYLPRSSSFAGDSHKSCGRRQTANRNQHPCDLSRSAPSGGVCGRASRARNFASLRTTPLWNDARIRA